MRLFLARHETRLQQMVVVKAMSPKFLRKACTEEDYHESVSR